MSVNRTICPLVINSSRLQQYQGTTKQPLIGPRHEKNRFSPMRKQRRRSAVTAQLINAVGFATWIVQFLFFLYLKFQASSLFLKLYMPVWARPRQKHCRPVFSLRDQLIVKTKKKADGKTSIVPYEKFAFKHKFCLFSCLTIKRLEVDSAFLFSLSSNIECRLLVLAKLYEGILRL